VIELGLDLLALRRGRGGLFDDLVAPRWGRLPDLFTFSHVRPPGALTVAPALQSAAPTWSTHRPPRSGSGTPSETGITAIAARPVGRAVTSASVATGVRNRAGR